MACCEDDSTALTWNEAEEVCTSTLSTCADGITTTSGTDVLASDCCSMGLATEDAALQEACQQTVSNTIEWNQDTNECSITSTTTIEDP